VITVNPQVVFTIFGIGVRDTVVTTWIMMAFLIGIAALLRKRRPALLEILFDFLNDMISEILGRSAGDVLPFIGSLAIFIFFANIIGIIPGLTTPTSDINTPIALALVVFTSVHIFGVLEKGFIKYFKELVTPIYLFPFELIAQLTRTISLSIRLFGNMLSGEFLVAVIFSILPFIVPLPLIGLHLFTGVLQAYIFTALSTVYIAGAVLANSTEGTVKPKSGEKNIPKEKVERK
jgi:F-type H+-transporting ATPase subunit a